MNITIIIPTYNEQGNIGDIINQLQLVFEKVSHHAFSILIFDSHSTDRTIFEVQHSQQRWSNVFLLTEKEKTGLGSAYIQAMQYAIDELRTDAVVEFDADGSHKPEFLVPMIEQLDCGFDVVVGSRYIKGGRISVNWPWSRRMVSVLGNWVARCFLTRQYHDFTSGYRITRTSLLEKINLKQLLSKQYAYKIHLLWWLHLVGAKIIEVPIEFIDRTEGESKFPRHNVIDSLYVVMRLRVQQCHTYLKMCLCGAVGALVS